MSDHIRTALWLSVMNDYRYCREDHAGFARSLVEKHVADCIAAAVNEALEKAVRRVQADCIGFAHDDAQLDAIVRDIRAMKSVRAADAAETRDAKGGV